MAKYVMLGLIAALSIFLLLCTILSVSISISMGVIKKNLISSWLGDHLINNFYFYHPTQHPKVQSFYKKIRMSFLKQHKPNLQSLENAELVAAILVEKSKEKKRLLQEILYDRYADKIYYKCKGILKDANTAKDLTHEVILKVFLNLHQYKGTGPLLSWILSITYNQCIAYLNKQNKLKFEEYAEIQEPEADQGLELEEKELQEIRLDQLQQLLAKLKESDRAILMMYYQDDLSIKEISHLLDVGESAAKMRLKRSRDHLAKLMKNAIR